MNINRFARRLHWNLAQLPVAGLRLYLYTDRRLVNRYPTWDELIKFVSNNQIDTVSFDVFDTLITRTVAPDSTVNTLIGRELVNQHLWPGTAASYVSARTLAQSETSSDALIDCYQHPALAAVTQPDAAMAAEATLEYELSDLIPGAVEAVNRIRTLVPQLFFVSDMHLQSETIEALLVKHGFKTAADTLVVSSEAGASKFGGELFTKLWPETSERRRVFHAGNNEWADNAHAARHRIKTQTIDRANPSRYETTIGANPNSYGPIIAAAARRARMKLHPTGAPDASPETHGTQFIGIAMMAFILWCRQRCQEQQIDQVMFLARDGELPLRMAKAMRPDHWESINLHYLHCSRTSWAVAAASSLGVKKWIDLGTIDSRAFLRHTETEVPLHRLLKRTGLSPQQSVSDRYFADIDPGQPLPATEIGRWHEFLADETTHELIEYESNKRKAIIASWLGQKYPQLRKTAMVDIGWRGQQSWMVSAIFREVLDIDPFHLHYGATGTSEKIDRNINIERFAFDHPKRQAPIDSCVTCMEMFLSAGQSRLLGYEKLKDGTIKQQFSDQVDEIATPTIKKIWNGAIQLAVEMPTLAECNRLGAQPSADLSPNVNKLMQLFWNDPQTNESRLLLPIRTEVDESANLVKPVIAPYNIASEIFLRRRRQRTWRPGSLAASPRSTRTITRGIKKATSAIGRAPQTGTKR